MDGFYFSLKKTALKYEYIGEFKKIGLKKDNSFANFANSKNIISNAQDEL